MDRELHTNRPIKDARATGLFPILADGPLLNAVFEYARTTYQSRHPLRMTGFDIQYSGTSTRRTLGERAFAFLSHSHPELATPENRRAVEDLIRGSFKPVAEEREKRRAVLERITQALAISSQKQSREQKFYLKVFQNIADFDQQRWMTPAMPPPVEADNFRDRKMAENLLWLANEWYPNEKIIVSAANLHILRNPAKIDTQIDSFHYKERLTMGHVLSQSPGSRVYSIGFTAYSGESGNPFMEPRRLPAVLDSSLEAQLHANGSEYLFVEISRLPSGHMLRQPMTASPLGYMPMKSVWADHFDAIFYTDVMFPNTKGARVPEGVRTAKTRR